MTTDESRAPSGRLPQYGHASNMRSPTCSTRRSPEILVTRAESDAGRAATRVRQRLDLGMWKPLPHRGEGLRAREAGEDVSNGKDLTVRRAAPGHLPAMREREITTRADDLRSVAGQGAGRGRDLVEPGAMSHRI